MTNRLFFSKKIVPCYDIKHQGKTTGCPWALPQLVGMHTMGKEEKQIEGMHYANMKSKGEQNQLS